MMIINMDKYLGIILFISFALFVNGKYYGNDFYQISPLSGQIDYQIPEIPRYPQSFHWQQRTPQEVENWPDTSLNANLGQVSGVSTSQDGNVHLFHRGNVVWDESSFDGYNLFRYESRGPIPNDTVLIVDPIEGKLNKSWGGNMFFMPHGISVDPQGNVWVTDVALHQVFRFKRDQYDKPDLVLGERFIPGSDEKHFCKPTSKLGFVGYLSLLTNSAAQVCQQNRILTDVAIASSGIVFISDGYCNSRILIFSADGSYIGQIGISDGMIIPHSITLLENEDLICVADRENRRILCYSAELNGKRHYGRLMFNVKHQHLGRVFAIDHIGDVLLAVNGPDTALNTQPHGISIDLATEQLISVWAPNSGQFEEPHDIAASADGSSFYVSEISTLSPKKVYKFMV